MFSEGVKGKIKSRILFEIFFFFRILLETCMIDEIATDVEKNGNTFRQVEYNKFSQNYELPM